eukprot:CAMPEP_0204120730 /NCGR_PEP_ID=MMETSP0361-20130328/7814_1 /ASSEMBLY_ACC=CAM_ASM_000343 /TAXON_ID=268821 /ORGANISM="Scrippsiella Hangoei, Strain SHTV-5" /LENGTH=69 /DNA_ID=CAMNT_0051071963 /DNA_START=53 /DNA_END=259 /DNA_ORIENTATION=-
MIECGVVALTPDPMLRHMSMPALFPRLWFNAVSTLTCKTATVPTRWRDHRQRHNIVQGEKGNTTCNELA